MTIQQITSRLRSLRRLADDTRGATLVEFAIVLVPLCILLLGGLDLAYQSYLRSLLQGALNDVARAASVESPTITCGTGTIGARIDCAIQRKVNTVARNANYTVTTQNFYQFSGVGRSEKLTTDHNHNGQYDTGDCWEDLDADGTFDTSAGRTGLGGADDVVFYEVTLVSPRIIPISSFLSGGEHYNIVARAAIRNQPYARQSVPATVCA